MPIIGLASSRSRTIAARLARGASRSSSPASSPSQLRLEVLQRQELVQGRIEQADRHRPPAHLAQDRREVGALQLAELLERGLELAARILEPGGAGPSVGRRAAPRPAASAPRRRTSRGPARRGPRRRTCARSGRGRSPRRRASGLGRVLGGVGVGAHAEPAQLVRPARGPRRSRRRSRARPAGRRRRSPRRVEPSIAIVSPSASSVSPIRTTARLGVDLHLRGPGDAGTPHAAGDERRVRGLAALRR